MFAFTASEYFNKIKHNTFHVEMKMVFQYAQANEILLGIICGTRMKIFSNSLILRMMNTFYCCRSRGDKKRDNIKINSNHVNQPELLAYF